jgi:hypothetical protein
MLLLLDVEIKGGDSALEAPALSLRRWRKEANN